MPNKTYKDLETELNLSADVFLGLPVQQKFSNRSLYEPKFVWVKLKTRTIHLSEHMTKERRHREANLDDVVSLRAGPPKKPLSKALGEDELCLTVQFKNGGGIDLKFKTNEERQRWASYLSKIVGVDVTQ
jgi:hypothetical protein